MNMGKKQMEYSVLMSVYQKELPENLQKSIKSMMEQTVKPSQIVLVKDGPLTEELDLVINELMAEKTDVFTIVEIEKNVGLAQALNIGIQYCRYFLVARMDSDDISLPKRCEIQLKEFELNPSLSIVGTNMDEFDTDIAHILCTRKVPECHEDICKCIHRRSPFNHPTVMYRKEDVLRCGNYQIKWKEDLDLFARMLNNGCLSKNVQQSLVLYRTNSDGIKRRKSWAYCGSFIKVSYVNYKRGYINIRDLIFIAVAQMAIFLMPKIIYRWLLLHVLREPK